MDVFIDTNEVWKVFRDRFFIENEMEIFFVNSKVSVKKN